MSESDARRFVVRWEPSTRRRSGSNMSRFMDWLESDRGVRCADYGELWSWSVSEPPAFWDALYRYFGIEGSGYEGQVLTNDAMPGARWFPGTTLNFAEHVFRAQSEDRPALVAGSERGGLRTIGWRELYERTCGVAAALRRLGVGPGDRVAGYLPNVPEAVATFLACAALGAIWSCCSIEFGRKTVVERLRQIAPKVVVAASGYRFGGRWFDRTDEIRDIAEALDGTTVLVVPGDPERPEREEELDRRFLRWDEYVTESTELSYERVPFEHPLWILFSSGTTGPPKAIVHSHGGILLEHMKVLSLQMDVRPGDRVFFYTTTGWMMWNLLISALLTGATVALYDGSPRYPDLLVLWRWAADLGLKYVGVGPDFLAACAQEGLRPSDEADLSQVRVLWVGGSPLPVSTEDWVYEAVKGDVWLFNAGDGTDVATAFFGGSPLVPVYRGEISCSYLGAKMEVFDERGRSVIDEVGELVLTAPMPSMPLGFWNDEQGLRYREAYFDIFPGVWRHGDWARISPLGTWQIRGRSDATINRRGVRIGPMEIYAVVESCPGVTDSLVVDFPVGDARQHMILFVALQPPVELDEELRRTIRERIRREVSPRHVPDDIVQVGEIPRTLTGKKMEVPVKRLLIGWDQGTVASREAMRNPEVLDELVRVTREIRTRADAATGDGTGSQ